MRWLELRLERWLEGDWRRRNEEECGSKGGMKRDEEKCGESLRNTGEISGKRI
ncbi:hypothetical protein MHH60_15955 [Paenibacillus sp. FSL H7-0716]|uniref:hypothetical protein n=1 Tax=Paenibacillus TaxID=44249 RepID=UPI0015C3DD0C|nr:hypothetical protein [Paenibacillus odorifer]